MRKEPPTLGHPLEAGRASAVRSADGSVDWLATAGRAFTALGSSTFPGGGSVWGSFLIIGLLFPPALLWASAAGSQSASARVLLLLAFVAVTSFGYVVWVGLLIRMSAIGLALEADGGGGRED